MMPLRRPMFDDDCEALQSSFFYPHRAQIPTASIPTVDNHRASVDKCYIMWITTTASRDSSGENEG